MARASLFDSFVRYLGKQGYALPPAALQRDVTEPLEPSDASSSPPRRLRRDGEPAQVCERIIDLDEGVMEWRYRHVEMVRRTIGDKRGTGGSGGASYLATTLLRPCVPGSLGGADGAMSRHVRLVLRAQRRDSRHCRAAVLSPLELGALAARDVDNEAVGAHPQERPSPDRRVVVKL
jgi:hypothetical protein